MKNIKGQIMLFLIKDMGLVVDVVCCYWVDIRFLVGLWLYVWLVWWECLIGWWLLLWLCWWLVVLVVIVVGYVYLNFWYFVLFLIGVVVMCGVGCIYNDIIDVKIDVQVEWIWFWLILVGQVIKIQVKVFLVVQVLIGLFVFVQFNVFLIWFGIVFLLLVVIYLFMKCVINWLQLFFGLVFFWGVFMGWVVVFGLFGWVLVLFYVGGILWIIGYDMIYVYQDKEDDVLVGVKLIVCLFGNCICLVLIVFYVFVIILFVGVVVVVDVGLVVFVGIFLGLLYLGWQILVLDIDDLD